MKFKLLIAFLIVFGFGVVLVAADYFGLFGTKTMTELDFATAQFKTVDADTGAPVFGSRVKCVQKGNDNACTLKDTRATDKLTLLFPRQTNISRTLLFEKNREIMKPKYPEVFVFFINTDYQTVNIKVSVLDILQGDFSRQTVKMKTRI